MNKCIVFKNNRLNNRDFNIDQNNGDSDFFAIMEQLLTHAKGQAS